MGKFYIVATPIGNLEDITLRALKTLREVDYIACEDTRVTKKLLARYEIRKPLVSYHQHSAPGKTREIIELLEGGKSVALVSDAGTPGISDPGNELVDEIVRRSPGVAVVPIPGPSALAAIASVAGVSMNKFVFLGFPPHKKGRKTFFKQVAANELPVVLYESRFRVVKTLQQLREAYAPYEPNIVIGRELTKQFETIYRGSITDVTDLLEKGVIKGEFTLVLSKQKNKV